MADTDGSIRVKTEIDNNQLQGDLKDLEKMVNGCAKHMKEAFETISTTKGCEKAVQKQIKALEKAKSKADEYEKQLEDVNSQMRSMETEALRNADLGMAQDTPRDIQDRADKTLAENKDYQKLIDQSIQLEDKWSNQNEKIKEAQANVDYLTTKISQITGFNDRVSSRMNDDAFLSSVKNAEQYKSKLEELQRKIEEIKDLANIESTKTGVSTEELLKQNNLYQELIHKINILKMNSGNFSFDIPNDDVSFIGRMIESVKGRVYELGNAFKSTRIGSWSSSMIKGLGKIKSTLSSVASKIHKVGSGFASALGKAKSFFSTHKSANNLVNSLKRVGLGLIGIRSAYAILRKISSAYFEQNQNLANQLSGIWTSLANALSPVIESIVSMITKALSYIFALIKAFTGIDLAAKSNANGLNSQAKATDNVTKATKKAERQLAGFDEMQKLSSNKDDTSNPSGAGAGGSGGASFQPVDVDTSWIDRLKEAWEKGFYETGKFLGESLNKILDGIDWDKIKKKAEEIGTNIALFLNGAIDGINWELIGKTIGEGLNTAVNVAHGFVSTFNFRKFGESLGTAFDSTFKTIDWKKIADTISKGLIGALNAISGFLQKVDWANIGKTVVQFICDIDWAGLMKGFAETAGSIAGAIVSLIGGAISKAFTGIGDYFNDKIEECGGNIILGILKGILDGIAGIGTWIYDNVFKPFIEGFGKVFSSDTTKNLGKSIIDGIKKGVGNIGEWFMGLLPKDVQVKLTAVKDALFTAAEKAYNALKNNTVVKTISSTIKSAFKTAKSLWQAVKSGTVRKTFTAVKKKVFDTAKKAYDSVKNKLIKVTMTVKDLFTRAIKSIWNGLVTGVNAGISLINKIPGVKISKLKKLARGGIVNNPTSFVAGEAGREAVLPLQNNTQWMDELADRLASRISTNDNQGNITIILKVGDQEFYRWLIKMENKNRLALNGG